MKILLTLLGISSKTDDIVPVLKSPTRNGKVNGLRTWLEENHPGVKVIQLPNIQEFTIKLGLFDPLALINGILRRVGSYPVFGKPNRNGPMNRYLLYMTKKLLTIRNDSDLYWKYAYWLLTNSNSYLLHSVWYIDRNLYRKLSHKQIIKVLNKVHDLRGSKHAFAPSIRMQLNRVYVPKVFGSDVGRPLGVPTLEWRIYTNMLLHLITMYVTLSPTQHGFIPKRGTTTAWKEMLKTVLWSKNIYEIDLKGCFPSISLPLLEAVMMERYNIPYKVARFYTSMNYTIPTLPKKATKLSQTVDESQYEALKIGAHLNVVTNDIIYHPDSYRNPGVPYPAIREFNMSTYYDEVLNTLNQNETLYVQTGFTREQIFNFLESLRVIEKNEGLFKDLRYYLKKSKDDIVKIPIDKVECLKFIGTIQGSPLSPFLSAILLDEIDKLLPPGVHVIKYADDMVFYGPKLFHFVDKGKLRSVTSQLGLTIHSEKSGWVKLEGKWLKPLKFLGLSYDGLLGILSAKTRKGSTLIYNKMAMLNGYYDVNIIHKTSYKDLMKQSLMYLNKGVKRSSFILYDMVINFDKVVDVIAYNLAHHYKELSRFKATTNNIHLIKLLMFISFMMNLPKRILYSFELRRILEMKDSKLLREFLKEVYTTKSEKLQVPYAQEFIKPLKSGPFQTWSLLGYREYYLLRNLSWFGRLIPSWREDLMKYSFPSSARYEVQPDTINLSEMKMIEKENEVLKNLESTAIVKSQEQSEIDYFKSNFPLYHYRTLFFSEYNNEYLATYRNKYTFKNLMESELFGFIQSKLYEGNWAVAESVQKFDLTYKPLSLCSFLKAKFPNLNIFTGSSYAIHYYSILLKRRSKITIQKHTPKKSPDHPKWSQATMKSMQYTLVGNFNSNF